jgi:hypothetical protein
MGVREVDRPDPPDPGHVDAGRIDPGSERQASDEGELGAGVEAVDVGAWVGLGVAQRLGLSQDRFE